jgi:hypothetical protein
MPVMMYPEPPHPSPHSYLAMVLFTLAFCLFWNITSVAFGIPALIFSVKVSKKSMQLFVGISNPWQLEPLGGSPGKCSHYCLSFCFLHLTLQSISASTNNKWKKAERYGQLALFFTMATWGYVGLTALVILGAVLGDYLSNYNFD